MSEGVREGYAIRCEDVRAAAKRIRGSVHRTPIMTSRAINALAGRELFFKCENLQRIGAFKMRGASNAVLRLTDEQAAKGVVTHSSGNHAQAMALAARERGIPAHIVMPRTAKTVKRRAVEGYGGIVHECEPNDEARHSTAAAIARETGAALIPSYDHPDIMAGQGTAALELLEDEPGLDAAITPVGGGGLLSGTCIAAKGMNPNIRVFAAEPAGADDAARSMATGERQSPVAPSGTICDGLLTGLGELTWPVIRDHAERIFTVEDEAIVEAMRLIWQRMKLVIEPSSATVLAVVLSDAFREHAGDGVQRIGVVLTGGNVDLDDLPW